MTTERLDDLLALAALGELTEDEERELDALVASDADAAEELRADLDLAATLQSTLSTDPPARLRQNVLDQIAQVQQDPPATAGSARSSSQVPPPSPSSSAPPASPPASPSTTVSPGVVSLDERRSMRARRWRPAAVAAAMVFLLAGGAFIVTNRGDSGSQVAAVLDAPDARTAPFGGEFNGQVLAVWSERENALVLDGEGLDPLPDDQTYQLWLIDGDLVTSVGLFESTSAGDVETVFDDVDPGDRTLAVTIEPAGGSTAPTLPVIATT